MKKLLMMIGAAVALGSFADTKTLTWNGASGAPWEGANWLDGETPSEWVDGANAVFTAAATVTLGDAVTVSNLTTSGALTIAGADTATYAGFVPKDAATLVFPSLKLSDITAIQGEMGGASISSGSRTYSAFGYHFFPTNGTTKATVQFQIYQGSIKCVIVEFADGDGGVYAKVTGACYVTDNTITTMGMNLMSGYVEKVAKQNNLATSLSEKGYGICQLKASVAHLTLTGKATLCGAFTFSNSVAEVTAPIAQIWNQTVSCPNGRLVVKGLSAATAEKTFGITDPNVSGEDSAWLNDTQILPNMVLSRSEPVRIIMRGSYITQDRTATPYHVKFNGETMTCQFQVYFSSSVRCVIVEFKQTGADVTARAVQSYYLYSDTETVTTADLGWDFESGSVPDGKKIRPYAIYQYAVKSMVLRTVDVPSLTLDADNRSCIDMVADNAQIVFSGATSQPVNLTACNSASVIYKGGTYNSGSGYVRRFESGSTMLASVQNTTEARAVYEFDASTNCIGAWTYINELILRNGSSVTGGGDMRCGYYNASPTSTYVSVGTSASSIEATITLMRHNLTGNLTNTLVFATEADLTISGAIKDHSTSSYRGSYIVKRGEATLTLSGANTFAGRLTVEAGTLALGGDDALPASAPLTLADGTVLCCAATNVTGALTLTGNATINLGDGSLSFADSSNETWADGAMLNIVGMDKLPMRSLRFGTDGSGLTTAQLKRIRYNGEKVSLNSEGYLSGPKGLIISFH